MIRTRFWAALAVAAAVALLLSTWSVVFQRAAIALPVRVTLGGPPDRVNPGATAYALTRDGWAVLTGYADDGPGWAVRDQWVYGLRLAVPDAVHRAGRGVEVTVGGERFPVR